MLLVALFSAAGGLTLGCSVGQTQIGLMFSLVLAPMMMFGCAYYPWSALNELSDPAEAGAAESAGVCERRAAGHAGAADIRTFRSPRWPARWPCLMRL